MTIMTRGGAQTWWKTELPKGVIYLYRDLPHEEWKEYTYAEHNAKKKEKQENNIELKRRSLKRVPCFIHVFKNNTDWFLGGWFIFVWSMYGKWYLNWKIDRDCERYLPMLKQHFNFGLLPFCDDEIWFTEFCKAYPMKAKGIQKPRGKYLTHCIIDSYYNKLIDIELEQENCRSVG